MENDKYKYLFLKHIISLALITITSDIRLWASNQRHEFPSIGSLDREGNTRSRRVDWPENKRKTIEKSTTLRDWHPIAWIFLGRSFCASIQMPSDKHIQSGRLVKIPCWIYDIQKSQQFQMVSPFKVLWRSEPTDGLKGGERCVFLEWLQWFAGCCVVGAAVVVVVP